MIGMLWYDGDKKTPMRQKVIEAARFYYKKHGVIANRAEVNLSQYEPIEIDGIEIVPTIGIIPNHVFIGRVDNDTKD